MASSAAGTDIGMMDPAYFIGRKAIIGWLNSAFDFSLTKIEETASGAVSCQILDAIFPGEVPMSKVRWDAKSSPEMLDNYKVIQNLFLKRGITKHLDVERLIRGKYQDNLEAMQWFKSFFEKNYGGNAYDPITRRQKGRGADSNALYSTLGKAAGPRALPLVAEGQEGDQPHPAPHSAPQARVGPAAVAKQPAVASPTGNMRTASNVGGATGAAATKRINELTTEMADLRLTVEALEKEREFYYSKLRDIEILLQAYTGPDKATVDTIFKILYATDENSEFVAQEGDTSMQN